MAQTSRHSDRRTWRLYDWIGPLGPIQCFETFILWFYHFPDQSRKRKIFGPFTSTFAEALSIFVKTYLIIKNYMPTMFVFLNPILTRLSELRRWSGKGRFALPKVNGQKCIQTSAKPIFCSLHFLNLWVVLEIVTEPFDKLVIFLAKIQCFRFGKADLPFPGQNRVKAYMKRTPSVLVFRA